MKLRILQYCISINILANLENWQNSDNINQVKIEWVQLSSGSNKEDFINIKWIVLEVINSNKGKFISIVNLD